MLPGKNTCSDAWHPVVCWSHLTVFVAGWSMSRQYQLFTEDLKIPLLVIENLKGQWSFFCPPCLCLKAAPLSPSERDHGFATGVVVSPVSREGRKAPRVFSVPKVVSFCGNLQAVGPRCVLSKGCLKMQVHEVHTHTHTPPPPHPHTHTHTRRAQFLTACALWR